MTSLAAAHLALLLASAASAPAEPPRQAPAAVTEPAPAAEPAPVPVPVPDRAAQAAAISRLLAREVEPLPLQPFTAAGGLGGQVEASGPPAVTGEGAELDFPIGTAAPIHCSVKEGPLDGPGTVRKLAALVAEKLAVVLARPTGVVAVEDRPVFLAEIIYRQATPEGEKAGQLKVAIVVDPATSLLCIHDEPGYSASFRRIVTGLARTLRGGPAATTSEPRWSDLLVVKMGEVGVGYAQRSTWARKGGGRIYFERTTMLLPRSLTELAAFSEQAEEEVAPDGTVDTMDYLAQVSGETEAKLHLVRQGTGPATRYRYEGEKSGKKLAGALEPRGPVASELWFATRLAKGAKVQAGGLRHAIYAPSADPTRALEARAVLDPARPRQSTFSVGSLQVESTLADDGFYVRSTLPIGAATLVMERAWSKGSP